MDWKDVKRGKDAIPYSKEAARDILLELPPFFTRIRDFAGEVTNFQEGSIEEDAKNS